MKKKGAIVHIYKSKAAKRNALTIDQYVYYK